MGKDGIIFISIGDDELENLKKICHEIFGPNNFIAQINIVTGANQSGEGVLIQKNVEYCLAYAKQISTARIFRIDKTEESWRNLNDAPTPWETRPDRGYTIYFNPQTCDMKAEFDYNKDLIPTNQSDLVYTDIQENLDAGYLPVRPGMRNGRLHRWRWGKDTFDERKNEIKMFTNGDSYIPKFQQAGFNAPQNIQHFSGGTKDLKKLFGDQPPFEYPKGVAFIKYLCQAGLGTQDVVLDFFSGSSTAAHAVMQLNAEDGGQRKFIMVQLPETCSLDSKAAKAGYKNICEIGKERIRRAGEKIKEEAGLAAADLDIGFRVFKVADSNMKDVYYSAPEYSQGMLGGLVDNIKDDRTDLDLLYGCLLEWGVELSLPHTSETIDGVTVHTVNGGDLIACFAPNIPVSTIRTIAKRQPLRVVFRDSSFAGAPQKINVEEIFKILSPATTVKVI